VPFWQAWMKVMYSWQAGNLSDQQRNSYTEGKHVGSS
jgi:hypothetical protein